uniref:Glutathione S-transferase kappa 1 n=1 Tax=Arcella intermedia TaxID=1963864 RepID=A0A6B2LI65_9EUKA
MTLRPFFLGGVMNAAGNKPPLTVPAKGKYMISDLQLCGDYFGVKIKMPSTFPVNTLSAQRLLSILQNDQPKQISLTQTLYSYIFDQDRDVSNPEVLEEALRGCGYSEKDAKDLLQRTSSAEAKEALKKTTEEAVARGAFGAPTIFFKTASGEEKMIFGSDRFQILFPLLGVPWLGPSPKASL